MVRTSVSFLTEFHMHKQLVLKCRLGIEQTHHSVALGMGTGQYFPRNPIEDRRNVDSDPDQLDRLI